MKERFCLDVDAALLNGDPGRFLRAIRSAGFSMVFLSGTEVPGFPENMVILRFAEFAAKYGLKAVNYHIDFRNSNLLWLDRPERMELIEQYLRLIRCCADAGMTSVTVHPTCGTNNLYVSQLGLDAFTRFAEAGERYGITVCAENLRTFVQLDYLFAGIGSERLGFCHDSGHEFAYMKGMDFPRRYASRLRFTHLHDNDGTGDLHLLPLDGELDFAHLKALYDSVGYTGPLSLEVSLNLGTAYRMDPETFALEAYRRMVGIFGE